MAPHCWSIGILFILCCAYGIHVDFASAQPARVCIVGAGVSGSSEAYFLRNYSSQELEIEVFERSQVPGGRMETVDLNGDIFEAGASILHPKNLHASRFADFLGLKKRSVGDGDGNFGIWDGKYFILQTRKPGSTVFSKRLTDLFNSVTLLLRYKSSLWYMNSYVSAMLKKFLRFYDEPRPIFISVEEMLKWAGLFDMTQTSSEKELRNYGLSQQLINELVTFIMRINYGQNMNISGMAGAVSLCGSGADFWAVEGGNWQIAAGLLRFSNASVHLNEMVKSISAISGGYEVKTAGNSKFCDAVVLATSLDESNIHFTPPITIPKRHMQHTFTTFVRGIINPGYFLFTTIESVPDLIGTLEVDDLPFSSINVLKSYGSHDKAYKIFSRTFMSDGLLDQLFSFRSNTVRLDWAAYPHYEAPEKFAPLILDGRHLYYINAFESAASTVETGAVAAENVARLLLSRLLGGALLKKEGSFSASQEDGDL